MKSYSHWITCNYFGLVQGLLRSLEKFAFEGIPDVAGAKQSMKNRGKMVSLMC